MSRVTLYSVNVYKAGWPMLLCGPTRETALAATQLNSRERIWTKWRLIDREGWNPHKEEIPVSRGSMQAIFWPTPGFKGEHLSALGSGGWGGGGLNFCVRITHCVALRCWLVMHEGAQQSLTIFWRQLMDRNVRQVHTNAERICCLWFDSFW